MRIQTLIVKGIIAGACLLIPSEVLANDHGKPEDLPEPPVNLDHQESKQHSNASDNKMNKDQQNGKSVENRNRELPPQANADVKVDQPGEKGNSIQANVKDKDKSVDGQIESKTKKNKKTSSADTEESGTTVHSDRSKKPMKETKSSSSKKQKNNQRTANKQDQGKTSISTSTHREQKDVDDNGEDIRKSKPNQAPLPSDESPVDSPIVIPSQSVNSLSKSNSQDGQTTTSGNALHLYGLSFIGDGPLVTLDRDFLSEHRREHNQWINAPPSPPPKSTLLPHRV